MFLAGAVLVYGISIWIVLGFESLQGRGPLLAGVTLDLVVTVPFAFYILVVRKYSFQALSVVPVVIVGVVIANLLLPESHKGTLRIVELILLPVEVVLLAVVGTRAYRAIRQFRSSPDSADPVEQFRNAAATFVGRSRVADIIGTEVACLYFSLLSWRSKPFVPNGSWAFTAHKKSGNAGLVLAAILLVVAEIIPIHLLVGQWSLLAAWILTSLSAYGLLLLVGDYRATVLRPILIHGNTLILRAGLRWNVDVPVPLISSIVTSDDGLRGDSLDLTIVGSATHWLVLSASVEVRGMYGIRRTVGRIGIEPDEPGKFEECLMPLLRDCVGCDDSLRGVLP
jgi:hypothetical protein